MFHKRVLFFESYYYFLKHFIYLKQLVTATTRTLFFSSFEKLLSLVPLLLVLLSSGKFCALNKRSIDYTSLVQGV